MSSEPQYGIESVRSASLWILHSLTSLKVYILPPVIKGVRSALLRRSDCKRLGSFLAPSPVAAASPAAGASSPPSAPFPFATATTPATGAAVAALPPNRRPSPSPAPPSDRRPPPVLVLLVLSSANSSMRSSLWSMAGGGLSSMWVRVGGHPGGMITPRIPPKALIMCASTLLCALTASLSAVLPHRSCGATPTPPTGSQHKPQRLKP
eukprot:884320-Prorocentrum_minimum.AAC.1